MNHQLWSNGITHYVISVDRHHQVVTATLLMSGKPTTNHTVHGKSSARIYSTFQHSIFFVPFLPNFRRTQKLVGFMNQKKQNSFLMFPLKGYPKKVNHLMFRPETPPPFDPVPLASDWAPTWLSEAAAAAVAAGCFRWPAPRRVASAAALLFGF